MKTFSQPQQSIFFPLAGQYLLDPNEFNGWGTLGIYDNSNTQDLGNVGAAVNRLAGGLIYPFDVSFKRFHAFHYNSNVNVEAWGWRIMRQAKAATPSAGSNDKVDTDILSEVNNGTLRNYNNTTTQKTEIEFNNTIIPAGESIVLGVEAPTANPTNYYVRILSGFLEFERVSQ